MFEQIGSVRIYLGDCLDVLTNTPEIAGVSAVVTDPPYGLTFMGKDWDRGVPGVPFWTAIRGVCKPGAYLLAFGGTRTYHRQTCAIEDSGFEIRDCLMWTYGSGFPKSLDLSRALDAAAGAERPVVGVGKYSNRGRVHSRLLNGLCNSSDEKVTAPATPAAQTWSGYGTAVKPALEPIVLAMNPRSGSFVDNVLNHQCGGLNIDGCRIQSGGEHFRPYMPVNNLDRPVFGKQAPYQPTNHAGGRWPANLLIDDSAEVVGLFPESISSANVRKNKPPTGNGSTHGHMRAVNSFGFEDRGSAARFFYCAKASRSERELGCEDLDPLRRSDITGRAEDSAGQNNPRSMSRAAGEIRNTHPTVKPLNLMRYLVRLVTQPETNLILDPFAGSGTSGVAAALAGLDCVLIEQDKRHFDICCARVRWAHNLRQRLGREPDLDLSPYMKRTEPAAADDKQTTLF